MIQGEWKATSVEIYWIILSVRMGEIWRQGASAEADYGVRCRYFGSRRVLSKLRVSRKVEAVTRELSDSFETSVLGGKASNYGVLPTVQHAVKCNTRKDGEQGRVSVHFVAKQSSRKSDMGSKWRLSWSLERNRVALVLVLIIIDTTSSAPAITLSTGRYIMATQLLLTLKPHMDLYTLLLDMTLSWTALCEDIDFCWSTFVKCWQES